MLEGEYLEMADQLKKKYDEITDKMEKIELLAIDLKKDFMTAYGVVRLLDHLISSSPVPYDTEIVNLVECLRGLLSDCVEKHILSITIEN